MADKAWGHHKDGSKEIVYAMNRNSWDEYERFECCGTGKNGEPCGASMTLIQSAEGENHFAARGKSHHVKGCKYDQSGKVKVNVNMIENTHGEGLTPWGLLEKFTRPAQTTQCQSAGTGRQAHAEKQEQDGSAIHSRQYGQGHKNPRNVREAAMHR